MFRTGLDILLVTPNNATGTGGATFGIPNDPTLVGGQFHSQYLVFDAPANTLDFVVSNSGRGTIGNR